jgi:hypothetical protein
MMPDTKRCGPITIEFDHTCDDAVSAALSMLAYGLSKLSADAREERLQGIEDGALRSWVSGFVAAHLSPYPRVNEGNKLNS